MKYVYLAIALLLVAVIAFAVINKVSPIGWGWWGNTYTSDGVALGSYDPVSYFENDAPEKGDAAIAHTWRGATWYFANDANRQRFVANPERFAPQFGGFCAFAVSKGVTAKPSPDAWYIDSGKLYVFADEKVRDKWVADIGNGILLESTRNWARRDQR